MQDKKITLDMDRKSHCVISLSSSSSSSNDDFEDFIMLIYVCEYDETFLEKMPQRTSILRGEDFVIELLNAMK